MTFLCVIISSYVCISLTERKPQTLLFSATVPAWLQQNSKKYLSSNLKIFDLIGKDKNKAATTVQV